MSKVGDWSRATRGLQAVFELGKVGDCSDSQLVERFVADREASAFAALVDRHGPMVWGVCQRVLGDHHYTEDAFQATFLVLARKAASVKPPSQGTNSGRGRSRGNPRPRRRAAPAP